MKFLIILTLLLKIYIQSVLFCLTYLLIQSIFNLKQLDKLFHILLQLSKQMQTVSINEQPLFSRFDDKNYAWQLLQSEIAVELSTVADGSDVARLLALYMAGVQRMNSLNDRRQAYFKKKMTSLMGKQSVIKGFNNNMKTQTKRKCSIQTMQQKQKKKDRMDNFNSPRRIPTISPELSYSLLQKKKQISVRLAYCAQQQSPENIQKILEQQKEKEMHLKKKIINIISDHQMTLQQRIRKRGEKSKIEANMSKIQMSFETEDLENKLIDNESIQDFILNYEEDNKTIKTNVQQSQITIKSKNSQKKIVTLI